MQLSGNTVLITGGASGIGLAMAERFLAAGSEVIICGRRADKLEEAQGRFPNLHTRVCDVSSDAKRDELAAWALATFPNLNVLVNNAGIQQRINLLNTTFEWADYQRELAINLDGPIHLTTLFLPHLVKQSAATIINVSSGLAITPAAWAPVYSATKAALHSFTMSLRLQVAKATNVSVIEILPPAVNTDLGGVGLHTFGAPLDAFSDAVFEGLQAGDLEIGYGGTEQRASALRDEIGQATQQMWANYVAHNPTF